MEQQMLQSLDGIFMCMNDECFMLFPFCVFLCHSIFINYVQIHTVVK